jgi:signal peptidase
MKALKLTVFGLLAALVLTAVGVGLLGWHEGYRAYAVRTGSMTPTYPTGALVIDRPADGSVPSIGQVITMQTSHGLVTHRVHGVNPDGIQTKGDANKTPDAWPTKPEHVVGVVAWGSAYLGYVLVFFQQPTGAPSILLLGFSIWFAWLLFFSAEDVSDDAVAVPAEPTLVDDRPALIVLPGVAEPATALTGERSRARSHLRSA